MMQFIICVRLSPKSQKKMRRFIMYMHDIHDVKNFYVEGGLQVPVWVLRPGTALVIS